MKQVFTTVFFFLFFCFPFISITAAQPKARKISADREAIKLQYHNQSFKDVLESISKQTGIHFIYKADAFDGRITTQIKASNWPLAVKQLLENYSRLEMWSSNLKGSRVWIFEKLWDKSSPLMKQYAKRNLIKQNIRQSSPRVLPAKSKPAPRLILH